MPVSWPRSAARRGVRGGKFDTGFIDQESAPLGAVPHGLDRAAVALGAESLVAREQARIVTPSMNASRTSSLHRGTRRCVSACRRAQTGVAVSAEGETVVAQVAYGPVANGIDGVAPATDAGDGPTAGEAVYVLRHGRQTKVSLRDLTLDEAADHGAAGWCARRCMARCCRFWSEQGERVVRGQRLAVIEAMKMEHA